MLLLCCCGVVVVMWLCSFSLQSLSDMFELPLKSVLSIVSKMIIKEELLVRPHPVSMMPSPALLSPGLSGWAHSDHCIASCQAKQGAESSHLAGREGEWNDGVMSWVGIGWSEVMSWVGIGWNEVICWVGIGWKELFHVLGGHRLEWVDVLFHVLGGHRLECLPSTTKSLWNWNTLDHGVRRFVVLSSFNPLAPLHIDVPGSQQTGSSRQQQSGWGQSNRNFRRGVQVQ